MNKIALRMSVDKQEYMDNSERYFTRAKADEKMDFLYVCLFVVGNQGDSKEFKELLGKLAEIDYFQGPQPVTTVWVKQFIKPGKSSWGFFCQQVYDRFPRQQLEQLPMVFWINLPTIFSFEQLVSLIREQLERPSSVGLMRHVIGKGKPNSYPVKNRDGKVEHHINLLLENGRLLYKGGKQLDMFERKGGLTQFQSKLFDLCVTLATPDGMVSQTANISELMRMLGIKKNGKALKRIYQDLEFLTKTIWTAEIKLPSPDDPRKKMIYRPAPLLEVKADIHTKGNRFPVAYIHPALATCKLWNMYAVPRDMELFKLPDEAYALLIYIKEIFKLGSRSDVKIIDKSLLTIFNRTNWSLSANNEKRAVEKLHTSLDTLVRSKVIKSYWVTRSGKKTRLAKSWYKKGIPLVRRNTQGKLQTDEDAMKKIIYHFEATETLFEGMKAMPQK